MNWRRIQVNAKRNFPVKKLFFTFYTVSGIMLRTGNWLSLSSFAWEKRSSPVYNPLAAHPNKMWSFRQRPTIFGYPRCFEDGNCAQTQVSVSS